MVAIHCCKRRFVTLHCQKRRLLSLHSEAGTSTEHRHASSQRPAPAPAPSTIRHPAPGALSPPRAPNLHRTTSSHRRRARPAPSTGAVSPPRAQPAHSASNSYFGRQPPPGRQFPKPDHQQNGRKGKQTRFRNTACCISPLCIYIYVYKYVLLCLYANGLKDRTLQPPRRRRSKSSVFLSGDAAPDEPSFGILRTMFDCGQAF